MAKVELSGHYRHVDHPDPVDNFASFRLPTFLRHRVSNHDVGQAQHVAPHHLIAWWTIAGSIEMAAETGQD
jgi:hypothetical protein